MPKVVYDPAVVDKIITTLASGVPKKYAAESNGVSYDALNDWEHGRGAIPKKEVSQLRQRIMQAEAQAVVARVARIAKAGQGGDWKADSWYLEHVHADVFATRNQTDNRVSGPDGAPLEIVFRRTGTK